MLSYFVISFLSLLLKIFSFLVMILQPFIIVPIIFMCHLTFSSRLILPFFRILLILYKIFSLEGLVIPCANFHTVVLFVIFLFSSIYTLRNLSRIIFSNSFASIFVSKAICKLWLCKIFFAQFFVLKLHA